MVMNEDDGCLEGLWRDWLTDDDDQDPSHNLENQGEGDERQDCVIVSGEEKESAPWDFFFLTNCKNDATNGQDG